MSYKVNFILYRVGGWIKRIISPSQLPAKAEVGAGTEIGNNVKFLVNE